MNDGERTGISRRGKKTADWVNNIQSAHSMCEIKFVWVIYFIELGHEGKMLRFGKLGLMWNTHDTWAKEFVQC